MVFVCQLAGERVAISQYVTLNYEPYNRRLYSGVICLEFLGHMMVFPAPSQSEAPMSEWGSESEPEAFPIYCIV